MGSTWATAPSPVNSLVTSVTEASTSAGTPSTRRHRTSNVESSSTTDVPLCWDFSALWSTSSSEESSPLLEQCKFVLAIKMRILLLFVHLPLLDERMHGVIS